MSDHVNYPKVKKGRAIKKRSSRVRRERNGQPFNLNVDLLIVTDMSVYEDQMIFAKTNNKDLIFLYMQAYYAHCVNGVCLKLLLQLIIFL